MDAAPEPVGLVLARCGAGLVYERRRPETTTLYEVVRDNLETLYGAVDDGDLPIALPAFVRKEYGRTGCCDAPPARGRRSRRGASQGLRRPERHATGARLRPG